MGERSATSLVWSCSETAKRWKQFVGPTPKQSLRNLGDRWRRNGRKLAASYVTRSHFIFRIHSPPVKDPLCYCSFSGVCELASGGKEAKRLRVTVLLQCQRSQAAMARAEKRMERHGNRWGGGTHGGASDLVVREG
ncbi:major facilitator superfamily domain-containing protein 6-A-like [Sesbania bispinosa]|nr:major facilitator superfamily domain-containing protein 6-A-like [Sesbania bispinosa]